MQYIQVEAIAYGASNSVQLSIKYPVSCFPLCESKEHIKYGHINTMHTTHMNNWEWKWRTEILFSFTEKKAFRDIEIFCFALKRTENGNCKESHFLIALIHCVVYGPKKLLLKRGKKIIFRSVSNCSKISYQLFTTSFAMCKPMCKFIYVLHL